MCLILPLPCVANSRYLTHEHLRALLSSAGYEIVVTDDSKRLTRLLLRQKPARKLAPAGETLREVARHRFWDGRVYRKRELVSGAARNNFCILLT